MNRDRRLTNEPISRRAFAAGATAAGLAIAATRGTGVLAGAETTPVPGGTPAASLASTPVGTPDASAPTSLVRVEFVGGFVAPETSLTALPSYQLTDDGVEISQGVQILIYPPPALPSLQEAVLSEDGIQVILQAANAAGLTESDQEFINPNITDLPNQVITVTVDGRTVQTTTFGLDQLDPADTSGLIAARDRIQVFLALIANPPSLRPNGQVLKPETNYDFAELQCVAIPVASFPGAAQDMTLEGAESAAPVEWPLESPLTETGQALEEAVGGQGFADVFPGARVVTVTGADLEALLPLAIQANQLTVWQSDGADWIVLFRPLLPGEVGGLARPANDPDDAAQE